MSVWKTAKIDDLSFDQSIALTFTMYVSKYANIVALPSHHLLEVAALMQDTPVGPDAIAVIYDDVLVALLQPHQNGWRFMPLLTAEPTTAEGMHMLNQAAAWAAEKVIP